MRLRRIGHWRSPRNEELPDPAAFVDETWSIEDRETIACYLDDGMIVRAALGVSKCRFCGIANGSAERTDLRFVWPEGLSHYVRVHSVRLPDEFVQSAFAMLDELDNATVDD